MRFAKLHGLGNDFVVVDLRGGGAEAERIQEPLVATRVCSRRFGVGADGILAILPPLSGDARMRVINADGSEAEMCGNGLRCVAKYLVERDEGFAALDELIIDTGAGPLRCRQVRDDDRGTVTNVQVEMGRPGLLRKEIPISGPPAERAVGAAIDGVRQAFTAVSMGNPHAVHFTEASGDALRSLAENIGPTVETHRAFPERTNVEFARVVSSREIELVVWERGCGITLACGTGACATVVAACLEGLANVGEPVRVNLLGGPLEIEVAHDFTGVSMTGTATHVFDGDLTL